MSVQNSNRDLKSYAVAGATGTDYVIGYISAANTVARATGTGVQFCGVIENNPLLSTDVARVCTLGITKVHAGTGAIAVGDQLTSDARGYAIKQLPAVTGPVIGTAEEASTQDGQLIEIKVLPVVGK
jgi:hypothetical protein